MNILEPPVQEKKRIEALKRFKILDTPADGNFDRITHLASTIFDVPIAIISLVDTDRIWFKSHYGLAINQIDRDPGLCASAILSSDTYVVKNTMEDIRTLANPLVAGEFGLRFYAAAPLQTEDNYNLGTLCLLDKVPRAFSEKEKTLLKELAAMVMHEMEMRLSLRNAVDHVKSLSSEMSIHLKDTITKIEGGAKESQEIVSYLDASRMFLLNIQNQLDDF
jgi:GAF domain-containing protein